MSGSLAGVAEVLTVRRPDCAVATDGPLDVPHAETMARPASTGTATDKRRVLLIQSIQQMAHKAGVSADPVARE
jgi:hypothetical protein